MKLLWATWTPVVKFFAQNRNMIRRILHSHYFFVPFFVFFVLPLLLLSFFFLFVRSALNFAPLSTTYGKSIAGSRLLLDGEAFAVIYGNMICTLTFFKEYQKTCPFPCFLYIIDRANFKKCISKWHLLS